MIRYLVVLLAIGCASFSLWRVSDIVQSENADHFPKGEVYDMGTRRYLVIVRGFEISESEANEKMRAYVEKRQMQFVPQFLKQVSTDGYRYGWMIKTVPSDPVLDDRQWTVDGLSGEVSSVDPHGVNGVLSDSR